MPPLLHGQAEAGGHGRPGRALRAPLRPPRQEVLAIDRSQLLQAKLAALVRRPDGERGAFPNGATLLAGTEGWVLVERRAEHALGGAMAWARRHGVAALHVVVDSPVAAGVLARRAACFTVPPRVWWVDGASLAAAEPAPPVQQPALSPEDAALAPVIVEAGAEPVVEHGVLYGEVMGLEVCRVTDGRLEVGVGKHDREAQKLVHAGRPMAEALRSAVAIVRSTRPIDLAAARWLRWVVVRRPELVGVGPLAPAAPPFPREDLRVAAAAPATGDGVVAVCSTGIDIDLVPTAADVRLMHAPDARLVLVLPERDDHPMTRSLAAALGHPAELVTVPDDWRALP